MPPSPRICPLRFDREVRVQSEEFTLSFLILLLSGHAKLLYDGPQCCWYLDFIELVEMRVFSGLKIRQQNRRSRVQWLTLSAYRHDYAFVNYTVACVYAQVANLRRFD